MVVVSVFFLCNCLAMIANILEYFNIDAVSVIIVSNLLVTINSSVNLFIYCAFGERFRKEISRMAHQINRRIAKCCIFRLPSKSKEYPSLELSGKCTLNRSKSMPAIKALSQNVFHIQKELSTLKIDASPFLTQHTCVEVDEIAIAFKTQKTQRKLVRQTARSRLNIHEV